MAPIVHPFLQRHRLNNVFHMAHISMNILEDNHTRAAMVSNVSRFIAN